MARKMNEKRVESFIKKLSYSSKILRSVFEDDHCPPEHFETAFQLARSTLGKMYYYTSHHNNASRVSIVGIPRSILLPMITHPQFTNGHLAILCSKKELDRSNWQDLTFFFPEEFLRKDSETRHSYINSTYMSQAMNSAKVHNDQSLEANAAFLLAQATDGKRSNSYVRPEAVRTKFFNELNQTLGFLNENGGNNHALALLSDLPGLRDLAERSLKKKEV